MNNEEKYEELIKAGAKEYHESEIARIMSAPQNVKVSDEFKRKMEQMIDSMDNSVNSNAYSSTHGKSPKKTATTRKYIRIAACVIVLLFAGAAVAGIANKEVGAKYADIIREFVLGGFTEYQATDNGTNVTNGQLELTYIPEGFELSEVDKEQNDGGYYIYRNDDKTLLFDYSDSDSSSIQLDNENAEHSFLVLDNNIKGDYYKGVNGNDESMLIWKQDGYMCGIVISGADGDWAEKELLNVANGVRRTGE